MKRRSDRAAVAVPAFSFVCFVVGAVGDFASRGAWSFTAWGAVFAAAGMVVVAHSVRSLQRARQELIDMHERDRLARLRQR